MRKLHSYIAILSLCFFIPKNVISQDDELEDMNKAYIIEQRIEMIAEELEDANIDFTTLFEELRYYTQHPLNLNKATVEELSSLYLLTDYQILMLKNHIEKNGGLMSLYELQSIEGYDPETIFKILPFVKVGKDVETPNITLPELLKNCTNELYLRTSTYLEDMEGFSEIDDSSLLASPNSRYLGDNWQHYARYRFKYSNRVSIGITGEKDAGETFMGEGQPYGFDFLSAHYYMQGFGPVRYAAVGDYQVQIGQGLLLWSGTGFRKSSDVMNIKKNPITIKPYTSVNENLFMRGGAFTGKISNIEATVFYSNKGIDANITTAEDSTVDANVDVSFSSFQMSGFHRTPSELEDKNAIGEQIMGSSIKWKGKKLRVGATYLHSEWTGALSAPTAIYDQFDFYGNKLDAVGADYDFTISNMNFFGEIAMNPNGGKAYSNGLIMSLHPRASISILHRNFDPSYYSPYSLAFGENSKTSNENGLYTGISFKPSRTVTLNFYHDGYKHPWLKSQADAPSKGNDYLGQVTWKPSKKMEIYLRAKNEIKQRNSKDDSAPIGVLVDEEKGYFRVNATFKVSESIRLRNRVEFSRYQLDTEDSESGYMAFQDIMYKGLNSPFSFSFRFAMFDTESYNTRIYAYENDVLYVYSIPAYYNRGTRTYLTLSYSPLKNLDCWFRIAQTYWSNQSSIGSGLSEITGKTKTQFRTQIRLKF